MRKTKRTPTQYPNIYEITMRDTKTKNYLADFSHNNKRFGEVNLTKLFGTPASTAAKAYTFLQEIRIEYSKGVDLIDKRRKEIKSKSKRYINENSLNSKFYAFLDIPQDKEKPEVPRDDKRYNKVKYYQKHIQPILGMKPIQGISDTDLNKVLESKTLKDKSPKTKHDLKVFLNPVFEMAKKKKIINLNPLEDLKFEASEPKEELDYIFLDKLEDVSKKIYNALSKVDVFSKRSDILNLKAFYYLSLMTTRRRGEIAQIKFNDIHNSKIYVRSKTAKGKNVDIYPLPKEAEKIIKQIKVQRENDDNFTPDDYIFTLTPNTYTNNFKKVLAKSKVKINKESKFDFHDLRRLFISTAIKKGNFSPELVDRCLSHKKDSNDMLQTYATFDYESREKVFYFYWEFLRGSSNISK